MATKQDRGTKRSCQNSECSAHFYDLNRTPIVCPICGAKYVIASSPLPIAPATAMEKAPRKAKKEEFADTDSIEEKADSEDTLDEVEADKSVDENADETFLEEEEEDGGDVKTIIGGAVSKGKDEP